MTKIMKLTSVLLLVVLCVGVLASCGGVGSYEKKLEKAGYEVEVVEKEDIDEANEAFKEAEEDYKIKAGLTAANEDGEMVSITVFASKKQAESYADAMKGLASISGVKIEVDGKAVLVGTEDGIKAALGK